MRPLPHALTGLALAGLALASSAQDPVLTRGGGAFPGDLTWQLDAGPAKAGATYGIVVGLSEAPGQPLPGVTMDVDLTFLGLTFTTPGLFGALDGAGQAAAAVPLPGPWFVGQTISAQALVDPGAPTVSNLTRTTPALPGTFAPTLGAPVLPIAGGIALPDAANPGDVLLAGGSGLIPQRYRDELEEFETAGLTFGVGLLSTSTALADGRVLFTGGLDLTGAPTADAAIWDPATGTTTSLTMGTPRAGHAATLMTDGRVMVTGGFENVTIDLSQVLTNPLSLLGVFGGMLASTEFFDPGTGTFGPGPGMLEARALHTATAMPGGEVLVAGGMTLLPIVNLPTVSNTAYTYNPTLGLFGLPSLFTGPRLLHSAIAQPDGSVLLVGGLSIDLAEVIATGDLSKLVIGARDDIVRYKEGIFFGGWDDVGTMSEPRAGAGLALLPSGDVLAAGGFQLNLSSDLTSLDLGTTASADVYRDGVGVSPTGAMGSARFLPLVASLVDGTVLILAGGGAGAEVYQP